MSGFVDTDALMSVVANSILIVVQSAIMLKVFENDVPKRILKFILLAGWMSSTTLVLINSYMILTNGGLFTFLGIVLPPPMLFSTLQTMFSTIIGILIYQNQRIWEPKHND